MRSPSGGMARILRINPELREATVILLTQSTVDDCVMADFRLSQLSPC